MNENPIHVGIDDDARYHGVALNRRTAEVVDLNCRPTLQEKEGSRPNGTYLRNYIPSPARGGQGNT
jgi:hypothetical protein